MAEMWHRTLKSLTCNRQIPLVDALPGILLGLRKAYKEDLKSFPVEMVCGKTLRIPEEFFIEEDVLPGPVIFLEKQ